MCGRRSIASAGMSTCGMGCTNKYARWHCACVIAWQFWNAPRDQVKLLRRLQARRCGQTGERLWKSAEVDHRVPLSQVWSEYRQAPWPALLRFWGLPNLQMINRDVHAAKSAGEARNRRTVRYLDRSNASQPRPLLPNGRGQGNPGREAGVADLQAQGQQTAALCLSPSRILSHGGAAHWPYRKSPAGKRGKGNGFRPTFFCQSMSTRCVAVSRCNVKVACC